MVKVDKLWSLVFSLLLLFSSVVKADALDDQRQHYMQVKQAWDSNQLDVVNQLMPTLKDYPLYPYLQYRQLTQDLSQISAAQIAEFMQQNPTLPPARTLPGRFIDELARRQDWSGILAFSPEVPKGVAAKCSYFYAKQLAGQQNVAWDGVQKLWLTGNTLPGSCDAVVASWQQAGNQTVELTQQRIVLAFKEGNSTLVAFLAKQLPADQGALRDALLQLQGDLLSVESFARSVTPTDFSRNVVSVVFARSARQDLNNARALIPVLVAAQKMSDSDRQALEDAVAIQLLGNTSTLEQSQWCDAVISRSHSTPLLEKRIRMALAAGDTRGLGAWLSQLPADALEQDEWRYWQASVMIDQGQREQGEAILRTLMQGRGFYPMAAAQKLNVAYNIQLPIEAQPDTSLSQLPEIARVRELMYWHMDSQARSEWISLVQSRSRQQQEMLARFALLQGWADLSVQATIAGKLWDNLAERFPLAWTNEFRLATEDKGITQSYAMAIARQESAWDPQAHSPVGAAGLMQLMPETALHTAQMNNLPGYVNSSQLLDPQINITLGTNYLEYVYQMFGRNRILSSAAYNAGPSRVNTWLESSAGRIDAVAFVESIPFSETRRYVKNVLAYDAFYRYLLNQPAKILTDAEWQRRY
jgi:soluble lytic murein transglycosylase